MSALKEWFSGSEIISVGELPKTLKGVNQKAKKECWKSRPRKGKGGGKEYHLHSLPEQAQATLLIAHEKKQYDLRGEKLPDRRVPTDIKVEYDPEKLGHEYEKKKNPAKATAEARHQAMLLFKKFKDLGSTQKQAFIEAAEYFNDYFKSEIADESNLAYKTISHRTLHGYWYGRNGNIPLKDAHPSDWHNILAPNHRGRPSIAVYTEESYRFFISAYLSFERLNFTTCYQQTLQAAANNKWDVPSLDVLKARFKKQFNIMAITLARYGAQKLIEDVLYSQVRDVSKIPALSWINGDGYQHNVFVLWPDGKIARPKTWFWQDIRSRKMLSWRTSKTEHADIIISSFGDLVEKYGIPDHATIDNTRAAANKWLTGGMPNRYRFKVKEDDPKGIFLQIGTQPHWSSVIEGHGMGRVKPIERAFGVGGLCEYVDKAPEFAGATTGANVANKPKNYGSKAVPLDVFLKVLDRQMAWWNAMEGRRTQMGEEKYSFDQVFKESYENTVIRKATETQRKLWLLSAENIKVKTGGTFYLEAGYVKEHGANRYQADELIEHIGEKITIRFDPQNLHKPVYAYTLAGDFIGECNCLSMAGFGSRDAARETKKMQLQNQKATKTILKNSELMTDIERAQNMGGLIQPETPNAKVVRGQFSENLLKVNERLDKETGEIITDEDTKKWEENFSNAVLHFATKD